MITISNSLTINEQICAQIITVEKSELDLEIVWVLRLFLYQLITLMEWILLVKSIEIIYYSAQNH